jgi:hypothetical protein
VKAVFSQQFAQKQYHGTISSRKWWFFSTSSYSGKNMNIITEEEQYNNFVATVERGDFKNLAPHYRNDHSWMLVAVQVRAYALEFASEALKNDYEIVMAAVTEGGYALKYASDDMKNDWEVVSAAVRQCPNAISAASETLRNDRDLVLSAVSQHGRALFYAPRHLKSDREVVFAAVNNHGDSLAHVSSEWKTDREIVLTAVKQNGLSLRFACDELKNDREVVLAAVLKNGNCFRMACEELRNDREIALSAVRQYPYLLGIASRGLRNDREVVLAAVNKDAMSIICASRALKDDFGLVLDAVSRNGLVLQHVTKRLRNDLRVVLAAVRQNSFSYVFASVDMKRNREVKAVVEEQERMLVMVYNGFDFKVKVRYLHSIMHHLSRNPSQVDSMRYSLTSSSLAHVKAMLGICVADSNHFFNVFLLGWWLKTPHVQEEVGEELRGHDDIEAKAKVCTLSILRKLGRYRSTHVKKIIGDYVGVFRGSRLRNLENVLRYYNFYYTQFSWYCFEKEFMNGNDEWLNS